MTFIQHFSIKLHTPGSLQVILTSTRPVFEEWVLPLVSLTWLDCTFLHPIPGLPSHCCASHSSLGSPSLCLFLLSTPHPLCLPSRQPGSSPLSPNPSGISPHSVANFPSLLVTTYNKKEPNTFFIQGNFWVEIQEIHFFNLSIF